MLCDGLVAPMGGSPPVPNRSLCDIRARAACVYPFSRTAWSCAMKLHRNTRGYVTSVSVKFHCTAPSRSRERVHAIFAHFWPVGDRGDRGDRRGTVAVREAYTERQQPGFRAGTSSSIHPLPPLARGPTGKAVLALEVCIRTLHGHAPWTRTGAPRWHRRQT